MNKVLKKIKKYDYILLTFTLGFIIIGVIYKLQEISPLGRNSMLTIDFFHQYVQMLSELYYIIKTIMSSCFLNFIDIFSS